MIPADLAYAETGRAPTIAPDEALVFVVELLEVSDPPADGETTVPADPDAPTTVAEGGDESTTTAAEGDDTTTTAAEG